MADVLLEVKHLKMYFPVRGGVFRRRIGNVYAVDDISFAIPAGRTLGLVGESGCGKTTVGRSVLRLYKPTSGGIWFDGIRVDSLDRKALRALRRDMQIIFQDPFESLNSRQTVGEILEEPFRIHRIGDSVERHRRIGQLLDRVGLAAGSVDRYPHEFSGGQRQRIGIARAIALNPRLLVCDEPVSALDVSIQSQILNLLIELQAEMRLTYLFIAHDLAVVKHISDRIAVMYLGKIAEIADAETLYAYPLHPYTRALISVIPIPDPRAKKRKEILGGDVPSPMNPPSGCNFRTRCPLAIDRCTLEEPQLRPAPGMNDPTHLVSCHRAEVTAEMGPVR
ncbi:MAG: ABC transporter ATP-binding protein [Desulfobacterales bacterium]